MKKFFIFIFLIVLSNTSFSKNCQNNYALEKYHQAINTLDLSKKIELLTESTKDCPKTYEILANLGDAYMQNTEYLKAHQNYKIMIDIIDNSKEQQAFALLRLMQSSQALEQPLEVNLYANQIKKIKQRGFVWDEQYEKIYLKIYQENRHYLTQNMIQPNDLKKSLTQTTNRGFLIEKIDQKPIVNIDIDIYFDYNSSKLTQKSQQTLKKLTETFKDSLSYNNKITVIGHTDTKGSEEYNQVLSEKRAKIVADYLKDELPTLSKKILAIGKGESEPISQGNTEQDHKINRRVTFQIQ